MRAAAQATNVVDKTILSSHFSLLFTKLNSGWSQKKLKRKIIYLTTFEPKILIFQDFKTL